MTGEAPRLYSSVTLFFCLVVQLSSSAFAQEPLFADQVGNYAYVSNIRPSKYEKPPTTGVILAGPENVTDLVRNLTSGDFLVVLARDSDGNPYNYTSIPLELRGKVFDPRITIAASEYGIRFQRVWFGNIVGLNLRGFFGDYGNFHFVSHAKLEYLGFDNENPGTVAAVNCYTLTNNYGEYPTTANRNGSWAEFLEISNVFVHGNWAPTPYNDSGVMRDKKMGLMITCIRDSKLNNIFVSGATEDNFRLIGAVNVEVEESVFIDVKVPHDLYTGPGIHGDEFQMFNFHDTRYPTENVTFYRSVAGQTFETTDDPDSPFGGQGFFVKDGSWYNVVFRHCFGFGRVWGLFGQGLGEPGELIHFLNCGTARASFGSQETLFENCTLGSIASTTHQMVNTVVGSTLAYGMPEPGFYYSNERVDLLNFRLNPNYTNYDAYLGPYELFDLVKRRIAGEDESESSSDGTADSTNADGGGSSVVDDGTVGDGDGDGGNFDGDSCGQIAQSFVTTMMLFIAALL